MRDIYLLRNNLVFRLFFQKVICLILFVFLGIQVHAQQQPDTSYQNQSQLAIEINDFSYLQQNLEKLSTLISETNVKLDEYGKLNKELNEINQISNEFLSLKYATDSLNFAEGYTATIMEFQQNWKKFEYLLVEWSDWAMKKLKYVQEQKNILTIERTKWKDVDSLLKDKNISSEILVKMNLQLYELDTLNFTLSELSNTYLNITTNLSEKIIYADSKLKTLEEIFLIRKKEVFIQNYPPIWKSFSINDFGTDPLPQAKIIWESRIRGAALYIESNKSKLLSDFFYFIIFFSFVFWLKRLSEKLIITDAKVQQSVSIVQRYTSVCMLIFFFYLLTYYSDAPEILSSGIKIFLVFPLLRILKLLLPRVIILALSLFTALIILQQFNVISESRTTIARLLLLVFLVISLLIIALLIKKKKFVHRDINAKQQNILKFFLHAVFIFFFLSLLANIIGYVPLSSLLINGILNSSYSILLFYTAILSVESIFIIFLKSKIATRIKIFNEYPDKVRHTLNRYFKPVALFISIFIIISNFGLKEIFLNWISLSLTNKFEVGSFSFTVENIFVFILSIWISVTIARLIKFLLDGEILSRLELARGVPNAISSLTSYLIIGFGIIGAVVSTGINLDSLAMLISALGVGIGFGLQDLVKNFISGLILIFERPIQIGDAVQIEEMNGLVKHIGIRSSTVRTWDGAEVIVPNGNLISNKLINWTLSDKKRRIDIIVGVAYESDVDKVMQTLIECAATHPDILSYPEPAILFNGFADSHLNFELRCWTAKGESWMNIRSEINISINKSFAEKNICIPFPQRDLHIKSNVKLNTPSEETGL